MFFKFWGAARNWLLNCSTISVWNEKKATAFRSLFYSSLKNAASLFEEVERAGLVVRNADDVVDVIGFLLQLSLLRSEEHTSELQSRPHLVCRLLLEKKK